MSSYVSEFNSTTSALTGGATFTGLADTTTGHTAAIITVYTDQDGTLYIDFSPDGTNWDRTLSFTVQATASELHRVTLVNKYMRVRLTNGSTTQTYLRLQTLLGTYAEPATALNATNVQPDSGSLLTRATLLGSPFLNNVRSSIIGTIVTSDIQSLAGRTFNGTTIDSNFWTATVANNGTATQAGGAGRLRTGTTANGAASYTSVTYARLQPARPIAFAAGIALSHSGTANNTAEWGLSDGNNGILFRLSGTTLYAVVRNAGSDIYAVASTSWNGNRTVPTLTNSNQYEIHYNSIMAVFIINNAVMHTITLIGQSTNYGLLEEGSLPIKLSNTNSGGSTTDLSMYCTGTVVVGTGPLLGVPVYKNITANATTVCKRSAGFLHRIVLNTAATGTIKLYDATSAANIFASIAVSATDLPIVWEFGTTFNTGLTVVTSASTDITVIYE